MTSSTHQSPESGGATPENGSNAEPQQSGFTAVNGRTPSNSSSPGQDSPEQARQPNGQRPSESHSSPGKRKGSGEPSSPPNEQPAQKKQHTLDTQDPSGSTIAQPQPEAPEQDASRTNPESGSERNTSDASWPLHEHHGSITSEAHLAEVLQNNMTAQQMAPVDSSPDQRYHIPHNQQPPYQGPGGQMHTPPGMTAPQLQKQRKRNFSNRTKTGCLTCRERKKKCDEAKPSCSNCQRGGFHCKGYVAASNPHFKSSIPRDQPQLQAKNGYYDRHFAYPMPGPPYYEAAQPDGMRLLPGDDAAARTIPQPQEPNLRAGYGPQQWSEQPMPPQQYPREGMQRPEYQQMPPIRDISHNQKQATHPPPAPVHPPHNRSLSQHAPPQNGGQPPQYNRGQPGQYTDQRIMAQSALDHPSSQQPFPQLSEKSKMLKGMPFNRQDPKLKQERYECALAIYRFNKNAIEPGNLSDQTRRDQFRQIIEISKGEGSPSSRKRRSISPQGERVQGRLGFRVEVEAPFHCEYGYNINLGDDVEIGPNCRIMDSCHVEIGARCIIGPDVKILALDYDHFSALPPGKKRAAKASRIVIGEDVFIGAGATILPGISVHKGATIGAGCVVSRDVSAPVSVVPGTYQRHPTTNYNYPPPWPAADAPGK